MFSFFKVVRLDFQEFHIEGDSNHCYDKLAMYDGNDNTGHR